MPSNCASPIAARLLLNDSHDAPISVELDFLQTGPQTWGITVETNDGRLGLSMGGKEMRVNGHSVAVADTPEYVALYACFGRLLGEKRSDVDVAPLELVADAFLCGRLKSVAAFIE